MRISICILLVIATLIAYMQVLKYGFVAFDDANYTSNWHIKAGLTKESIIWAFSTSYASNWHPVTWLSHMLDYELYGLEPFGHHLTSLLFHIINTLLLFGVLLKMTERSGEAGLLPSYLRSTLSMSNRLHGSLNVKTYLVPSFCS